MMLEKSRCRGRKRSPRISLARYVVAFQLRDVVQASDTVLMLSFGSCGGGRALRVIARQFPSRAIGGVNNATYPSDRGPCTSADRVRCM